MPELSSSTPAPPAPAFPPENNLNGGPRAYVLFDGHDHHDGVFESYHTTTEREGIDHYIKGYPHACHKSFGSLARAQQHYQEVKSSGVLNILKQDVQPDDVYVVLQGVKPGVYIRRSVLTYLSSFLHDTDCH